jgi:hypothetical protein
MPGLIGCPTVGVVAVLLLVVVTASGLAGGAPMALGLDCRSNKSTVPGRLESLLRSLGSFAGGGGPSPNSAIRDMYSSSILVLS